MTAIRRIATATLTALLCLLAGTTASAGAAAPAPLAVTFQSAVYSPATATVRFTIVFNRAPSLDVFDAFNRPADQFQYFLPDSHSPVVVIRAGEVRAQPGLLRIRDAAGADPDPASGGWGPVRGTVALTLTGNVLTFSAPTALVSPAAAGIFSYELETYRFGASIPPSIEAQSVLATTPLPVSDGAISLWRLGDLTGTTAKDAIATNDGRYSGGFKLGVTGAPPDDAAVELDGLSGSLRVPDSPSLRTGDQFSLEVWLQRRTLSTAEGASQGLMQKDYQLYLDGFKRVVLRKPLVGIIATSTVPVGALEDIHHVVATKSGPSVHLYIDGVDVTGPVHNYPIVNSNAVLLIGSGAGFFRGILDEAAVYGSVLSPAAVAQHFAAGR